jgi:hypothetical protein
MERHHTNDKKDNHTEDQDLPYTPSSGIGSKELTASVVQHCRENPCLRTELIRRTSSHKLSARLDSIKIAGLVQ